MIRVIILQVDPEFLINFVGGTPYNYSTGDIERDFHQFGADLKTTKVKKVLTLVQLPPNLIKILKKYGVEVYGK